MHSYNNFHNGGAASTAQRKAPPDRAGPVSSGERVVEPDCGPRLASAASTASRSLGERVATGRRGVQTKEAPPGQGGASSVLGPADAVGTTTPHVGTRGNGR